MLDRLLHGPMQLDIFAYKTVLHLNLSFSHLVVVKSPKYDGVILLYMWKLMFMLMCTSASLQANAHKSLISKKIICAVDSTQHMI